MITLTAAQYAELTDRLIRLARGRYVTSRGYHQAIRKPDMVNDARKLCDMLGIHYGGSDAERLAAVKCRSAEPVGIPMEG